MHGALVIRGGPCRPFLMILEPVQLRLVASIESQASDRLKLLPSPLYPDDKGMVS